VTEAGPEEWLSLLVLIERKEYVDMVKSLRDSYTASKSFSIKQVLLVLWRLKQNQIQRTANASRIRLAIRDQAAIKSLPAYKFDILLSALPDWQKLLAQKMRGL
jgi:hypothetical protein